MFHFGVINIYKIRTDGEVSVFIYCLEQYSSILMVYMEIHYSIFTMKLNYSTKSTYT